MVMNDKDILHLYNPVWSVIVCKVIHTTHLAITVYCRTLFSCREVCVYQKQQVNPQAMSAGADLHFNMFIIENML